MGLDLFRSSGYSSTSPNSNASTSDTYSWKHIFIVGKLCINWINIDMNLLIAFPYLIF